jgi:NADPH:quinone reductase
LTIVGFKAATASRLAIQASRFAGEAGLSRYGSTVHKQVYIYGSLDKSPTELTRNYGMAWGIRPDLER